MDSNENKNQPAQYKFRSIKVHSSDEWMADATKKYRKVYDRYETTYIRVEFSVFNKLFDEAEWDANVRLKCFFVNGTHRRELCNLQQSRKIGKDENIVYFRDSWGQSTLGTYWLKGTYVWEGYIDEVKAGEATFYIEDVGAPRKGENLFFDIESARLFEGDGKASQLENKKYLKTFSQKETRYVWSDFRFKNKVHSDYYAELFFNFYDKAGLLKGSSSYVTHVAANTPGQVYTLFPGWGGETPGRWGSDTYTMEVIFMDNLIATIPFNVADAAEEGDAPVLTNGVQLTANAGQATTGSAPVTQNSEDLLFESLAELNSLTGLTKIKQEVNEMVKLVKFYQETGKDILNKFSLHTVFTGNPGTGKTTVARILSKIYKGLGVLEKGHLVEVDREGLVAGYVGQTAIKTGEKINEAMGGILFIDEAYSLAQGKGSQYDFGGEAIQIILKRMEDNRGKFGVIVAGYTENMHQFIESNPGLKSRFDMYFEFPDYEPEEMNSIAQALFKNEGVKTEETARKHLEDYFAFLHSERDQHFGNARSVRQVVGESVRNQHLRLASMTKEERTPELMETIIFDDVKEFEIKPTKSKRPSIGFQTGNG
ncbi:MAG: AAA family ATPase [Cyclobacteriaceae bacterium]|nr:AAA family ATPase [Cyclobacteriaceae bacterium]